ncbi:MAG: hypothetical protein ACM3PE_12180 [Deltaproteobacteria bacterium]
MNHLRLAQPHEIDLSKINHINVTKVLTEDDIERLRQGLRTTSKEE